MGLPLWVLDHVFQPIANRFQERISPIAAGIVFLEAWRVLYLGDLALDIGKGRVPSFVGWLFVGLFLLALWGMIGRARAVDRSLRLGMANPLRYELALFRAVVLTVPPVLFVFTLWAYGSVFPLAARVFQLVDFALAFAGSYFISCQKLPPPERREVPASAVGSSA